MMMKHQTFLPSTPSKGACLQNGHRRRRSGLPGELTPMADLAPGNPAGTRMPEAGPRVSDVARLLELFVFYNGRVPGFELGAEGFDLRGLAAQGFIFRTRNPFDFGCFLIGPKLEKCAAFDPRSVEWHSAVSQIDNLRTLENPERSSTTQPCRMPFGDTADYQSALAVDANGDVFVTGSSPGIGSRYNYATIAYSGSGVPLWTNRYNGPSGYDFPQAMALDAQGNVFVTGNSEGSSGYRNYATVAYSNGGVPLWTNRYEGGYGQATAIAVDTNGNVFVTGYCTPNTNVPNHTFFVTLKYSPSGVPIWTNFYNGLGKTNDTATSIAVNNSGEVFVTGYSATSPFLPIRYYYTTIKYSSAGVPLWTNLYDGGVGNNEAAAVRLGPSGNVFVTGYAYDTYGYSHCTTIAYSTSGAGLWTNRFINDYSSGAALAVDSQGNVDVAGYADASGEYLTIQYSAAQPIPLGIQQISNQIVLNWTNAGFLLQAAPSVKQVGA